jgi:Mn-dependent DtxR family transcriptional regulator
MSEEKEKVESFLRDWFKKHSTVYPSDVADALKMNYSNVVEIFGKLEVEGKLERAKFVGYKLEMRTEHK